MLRAQDRSIRIPREYWLLQSREYAFVVMVAGLSVMLVVVLNLILNELSLPDWPFKVIALLPIFVAAVVAARFTVQLGWKAFAPTTVERVRFRLARQLTRSYFRAKRLSGAGVRKYNPLYFFDGRSRWLVLTHSALLGGLVAFAPSLLASVGFPGFSPDAVQSELTVMAVMFAGATAVQYITRRIHWHWVREQMNKYAKRENVAQVGAPVSINALAWTGRSSSS
ncbi:hypothetical protein [Maricaulis sp. MIT060901]|uniref:hypothetical protein n=1 Tax=Maricaulis sp. MIT060901 TaxID=3096993 RepID=UPI00399B2BD7